jgi:amidophosphoribosyltransferase
MRQLGIRVKLNPLRETIRGRRLVVVDDSIVRGNTTKAIVGMLREAGALEVHVRITSPPVRWPCFYGIDMPTRAELIASDLLTDEVSAYIGADSLAYLSLEAMTSAAQPNGKGLCTACFTGGYPIPVDFRTQGKALLEGAPPRVGEAAPRAEAPAAPRAEAEAEPRAAPSAAPHAKAPAASRAEGALPRAGS